MQVAISRLAFLLICAITASVAGASETRALNALLTEVFAQSVDDGYVDYPAIARNVRFYKYLDAIAEFDAESLTDDNERKAFWINAYNALAIKLIIDGKSPNGMMDRIGFFGADARVAGRDVDLKTIDGEILAPFADPRLRFALVPAQASAPKLQSFAFNGTTLDEQLDQAARDFINDKRRNRFSDALRAAKLSRLFEQYHDEFGAEDRDVLKYVATFVADEGIAKILERGDYTIKYMEYDPGINGNPIKID
jgi:hypothetical protein